MQGGATNIVLLSFFGNLWTLLWANQRFENAVFKILINVRELEILEGFFYILLVTANEEI